MSDRLANSRRVLFASLAGTTVEFYDFYVFGTATALVFGPLFFPKASPAAQMINSFMVFGLAFLARPVGAVVFGHFGDRLGRRSTLVASLLLMGVSTLLIAFLPDFGAIGWLAPALLCILRLGQGLGLGGEWGGATLVAVENAPPGWETRYGMTPQLGAPLGFLFANGLFLLLGRSLSAPDFIDWGWRIPFVASALLVGVGLWVRLRIVETPAFGAAISRERPPALPIWPLLRRHWGNVFAGIAIVMSSFSIFYLCTVFALALGAGPLGYGRQTFLGLELGANLFLAIGMLAAGWWGDRVGARTVLAIGALATVGIGLVFGSGLNSGSLPRVFVTLAASLFTMGLVAAPLGSWLPKMFPVQLRYTGISIAFSSAGVLGGAVAPVAAKLITDSGHGTMTGLIMSVSGLVTLIGVGLSRAVVDGA